jgi:hypothetical protein
VPLSLNEARRLVAGFVDDYNRVRLHSAISYVAPVDKLAGTAAEAPSAGTISCDFLNVAQLLFMFHALCLVHESRRNR